MLAKINAGLTTALVLSTVWLCFSVMIGSTVAQGAESQESGSSSVTHILSLARIAQAVVTVVALTLGGIFA